MKSCFVVCPIGEEETEIRKNADWLFDNIIEPACKIKDYKPTRCDKILNVGKIDNDIEYNLENAELVIADLSENNLNVFFEVGYRYALASKKMILMCQKQKFKNRPFDIDHDRTIDYEFDTSKAQITIDKIVGTIEVIETQTELSKNRISMKDVYLEIIEDVPVKPITPIKRFNK